MQLTAISSHDSRRLILLFLGWGMDASCVSSLQRSGFSIMAIWDYTGFESTSTRRNAFAHLSDRISGYSEIVVIGWSFGVRIATDFLLNHGKHLPITLSIAVNGTPSHIDDNEGIPQAIFRGTLQNLSELTVRKFRRRMFCTSDAFQLFMTHAPERPMQSLTDELCSFARLTPSSHKEVWQLALIADSDFIIPTANQRHCWQSTQNAILENTGHFPDFQSIINRYTIDKTLVEERFTASLTTYDANAGIQQAVANNLWEMTKGAITHAPESVLEIGAGSGLLTNCYNDALPESTAVELWDLIDSPEHTNPSHIWRKCDAETAILHAPSRSRDLILSASTLQWFHSPERFINESYRILSPGGTAAFAIYGNGTYSQIAASTGVSLNYPSLQSIRQAIPEEAECLVMKEAYTDLQFPDIKSLLHHIKNTGVNAAAPQSTLAALKLARSKPNPHTGKYHLTYHTLYIIIRKPLP